MRSVPEESRFVRARSVVLFVAVVSAPLLASAQAEPTPTPSEVQCVERAERDTLLPEPDRDRLCLGTASLEPITCYREAVDEPALESSEAVDLCRCAASTQPVSCFREALRTRPDEKLWALRQCSPIAAGNLTADCRPVVPIEPGLR
jgi:hypothetical protein